MFARLVLGALAIWLVACGGQPASGSSRVSAHAAEARTSSTTTATATAAAAPIAAPPAPIVPAAPAFEPVAFGAEVSGSGRPIILIPGLGCPGDVWKDTVAHLAEGYQVHVLTLSGFAGRPAIDEPLLAAVHRDLARYIQDRKLEHPIVVGHSLGGVIAYRLASVYPDLVGPVVIVDQSPAHEGGLDGATRLRAKWKNASKSDYAALVRSAFLPMTNVPKRMEPMLAVIAKSDPAAFGNAIFEMMTTSIGDLKDIGAPVLIFASDAGDPSRIRQDAAPIRMHEVVVLRRTRHFVMWDDPTGFHAALDKFLAAHS